jgi:molybdopterin molybdotransferase
MITISAAIKTLLSQVIPLEETLTVNLSHALGSVLAEDIIAPINVPPAANSAMDGYAINIQDLSSVPNSTTLLAVSQTIAAGHPASALTAGTAARIFTGGEIPPGANAVVMQEQCVIQDSTQGNTVEVPSAIPLNNNIRPQAQDIQQGECIVKQGRHIQPQDLGLLASVGISHLMVYRKLRVAILSTGDELVEPGKPLTAGKIYNSNRYLLQGFLQRMGIETIDCGDIEDTASATISALKAAASADCIISTGGVSVGDEDHVKDAVMQLGELGVWRIAIKPGKPVAFGSIFSTSSSNKKTPFIGLPGNPAAVFITFLLLARPFLMQLQHQTYQAPKGTFIKANFSHQENPKRQEYLRAKINDQGTVDIYKNQSSGVLSSISWAEGLVLVPPQTAINSGDTVEFIRFVDLF